MGWKVSVAYYSLRLFGAVFTVQSMAETLLGNVLPIRQQRDQIGAGAHYRVDAAICRSRRVQPRGYSLGIRRGGAKNGGVQGVGSHRECSLASGGRRGVFEGVGGRHVLDTTQVAGT